MSASFVDGAVLVAFHEAQKIGVLSLTVQLVEPGRSQAEATTGMIQDNQWLQFLWQGVRLNR
jgi:hypothetical protein